MAVLDKAKYHLEGDFPKNLPKEYSYTLGGMFFAWCAENDFLSESMGKDFAEEITKLRSHLGKPSDLYRVSGGVLSDDELNSIGIAFASDYFDFDHGQYLDDFIDLLADKVPTVYHAEDDWKNYERLKKKIDERFVDWRKKVNS